MKPYVPFPRQELITRYIIDHPRCAIWSYMGSGKTAATIQAIDIINLAEPGPTLIIAPLRVARSVWSDELDEWSCFSHLTISKILGDPAQRTAALKQKADFYTINFENIPWLIQHYGTKWPFTKIVFDESSRLRGYRSRQGAARPRWLAKIVFAKVNRFIELTGTPAPNGIEGLWGQAFFLDQGERLGRTFSAFSQRWFYPDYSGFGLLPHKHAQVEIEQLLSDICLTIKSENTTKPIVNIIYVDLPHSAMKLYKDMEKRFFLEIKGHEVEAVNAAVKSGKCLQIANGAAYVEGSNEKYEIIHDEKIYALESIIEESAGMPVLVVYTFRSDLDRLRRSFPRGKVLDQNEKTIKDWNLGKIPVLFVHPQSAGHGLSLQHGSNIIAFFSINWDLENHDQVRARLGVDRQAQSGYDRPVFEHYILARNTIDELVMERLESKRSVQDILLEAMKAK